MNQGFILLFVLEVQRDRERERDREGRGQPMGEQLRLRERDRQRETLIHVVLEYRERRGGREGNSGGETLSALRHKDNDK